MVILLFTARANIDYTPIIGMSLGFSPTSIAGDMKCVDISIINDSEQEATETLIATVAILESDGNIFTGTASITIIDDDGNL